MLAVEPVVRLTRFANVNVAEVAPAVIVDCTVPSPPVKVSAPSD